MPPTPGLGETLFVIIMVAVVFFGEKIPVIADAIGRARKGPAPETTKTKPAEKSESHAESA